MAKFKIGDCVVLKSKPKRKMKVASYGSDGSFNMEVHNGQIIKEHDPQENQTVLHCVWPENGQMTWTNYHEDELKHCK